MIEIKDLTKIYNRSKDSQVIALDKINLFIVFIDFVIVLILLSLGLVTLLYKLKKIKPITIIKSNKS